MDDQQLTKKQRKALKKEQKLDKQAQKQKKKSVKKFIGWGIGIAVLIGLGFFLKTAFTPAPPGTVPELQVLTESDQVKGASTSKIVLVEYSDFQCPACRQYIPIVNQLVEEKGDDFVLVYRHFPLSQHKNADEAARASEAAGRQDKFWDMHDMLFERQDAWAEESSPDDTFISYAEELELDIDQFVNDYNLQEIKDKITTDYNSGVKANVRGTPSFYLNGDKVDLRDLDEVKQLIDESNSS